MPGWPLLLESVCQSMQKSYWSVIYLVPMQTLMDPDKRTAYDALMGFTSGAINPFNDRSHAPDKATMPWHHASLLEMSYCLAQPPCAALLPGYQHRPVTCLNACLLCRSL